MDDDPLLQELLDLDEGQEEVVGDSTLNASSGTQYTTGATQMLNAQLASQSQAQMGSQSADPSVTHPQQRPAPPQLTLAQQAQQDQSRRLLGSSTLTMVVSVLLKLLAGDPTRAAQVKHAVRAVQARQDHRTASNELMAELNRICGQDMFRQAVKAQQRFRAQQVQQLQQAHMAQQAPAVAPQQQIPPPQQTVPQQVMPPPQQQMPQQQMPQQQMPQQQMPQQQMPQQQMPQQQMPQQQMPQQQMPPPQQQMPQQQMPPPQQTVPQQAQAVPQQQQQQPVPSRGVSPAPGALAPQVQQQAVPPVQQQVPVQHPAQQQQPTPQPQQPRPVQAPFLSSQPIPGMAMNPAAAFSMQLQAQQLAAQQAQQAAQAGLTQGLPAARGHMPGAMARPTTPMLPTMPGQQTLGLPQVPNMASPIPKPRPAVQQVKRGADGSVDDGRDAKRAKGPVVRKEKDKEGDMHDILDADAFIDMEQETDQLMAGLAHQRQMGSARLAKTQLLSEWRVANEMLKQLTKAGLKRVKPECFEILQLAFQAHATRILSKAHGMARHRQDTARKLPEMVTESDPRRGVGQIDRRERTKHDARLAAEREELLKAAQSKKADDETKEKAQKAKAELQGKQQASAANAAVAARLSKGAKWNKWDKWGGGGGAGGGGPGAGGGKKKGGKGGAAAKEDGKGTGAAAAEGSGPDAAPSQPAAGADGAPGVRFSEPAGGAGGSDGAVGRQDRAGSSLQASRSRAVLGSGEEGGDTIHLKDIVAVLERDPMYCKSPLMYQLINRV